MDTPEGRVELSGTGEADIVAEGDATHVHVTCARALLRHVAHRLPMSAKGNDYADLGRLDFDAETCVTLALLKTDGVKDPRGRIPLALGAGPMRLSLDGANLWAGRDADFFRAKFGFRGIDLVISRRKATLWRPPKSTNEPTLIVRLPPQHVMEESFLHHTLDLPGRNLRPDELASAFNIDTRAELLKQVGKDDSEFVAFAKDFQKHYNDLIESLRKPRKDSRTPLAFYPSAKTSELEEIYIGPDGLITPLGRRVARETAQIRTATRLPKLEDVSLSISEIIVSDVLRRHDCLGKPSIDAAHAAAALKELLFESASRNADMSVVLRAWRDEGKSQPLLIEAWRTSWPRELREKSTSDALTATLKPISVSTPPASLERALQDNYRSLAPSRLPVVARAAGETRLVFTIPLKQNDSMPWALADLLEWGAMDLRVSGRAESRLASVDTTGEPDLKLMLERQLGLKKSTDLEPRLERLRSILRSGPKETETAIELPARLILSPDREPPRPRKDAAQRPQRFQAGPSPHARLGRVPLWHADLHETPGEPYSLRAIHTPDFESDVYPLEKAPNDPLRHPERGLQAGQRTATNFALDDFDRRQIVALSSLYGLPVLARRAPGGVLQTSQVDPPEDFRIKSNLQTEDADEQALYVPRALPTRLLRLTALGGTLDLEAPFIPPAPLRARNHANIFDAYSVERVRILISLGREVTTEVIYKGFLYPLGFRAALLKVTERQYLPWPDSYLSSATSWRGPLAFQVQRYFIQISNPNKTFPGSNQPFVGRGWPARTLTMLTQRTPDLLYPTSLDRCATKCSEWEESPNGWLDKNERSGLVFWPRTGPGERGNVRFRFTVDGRPEPVSMPLIFVDNQAAHDAPTMRELQRYWNDPTARAEPSGSKDAAAVAASLDAWGSLRRLDHAGARRRYADEDKSGDTTFETLNWDVRVDSREALLRPRFLRVNGDIADPASEPPSSAWQMNSAMESDDQPPFYPRCMQAIIRHDGIGLLTGNAQSDITVSFLDDYLDTGLPVLRSDERIGGIAQIKKQAEVLADERKAADTIASGGQVASDPQREAFLRILHNAAVQTMGRNGERAAGVMRPEMDYAFIGRKGPIGTRQGTVPATVPNTVEIESVLPDARICGLVSLRSIIQEAKDVAAPLLRQTVEYGLGDIVGDANTAAKALAKNLLDGLKPILKRFQAGDSTAQLLQNAYPDAVSAIMRLEPALVDMAHRGIDALPDAVTAVRDLSAVLDRLAADPLGPLTDMAQNRLSDLAKQIEQEATEALENEVLKVEPPSVSEALRDAVVPLGNALLAVDEALDALQPLPTENEAKELGAHASRAFSKATRDTFSMSLDKMPNDLAALKQAWHERVKAALADDKVVGVDQPRVETFDQEMETAWTGLEGFPVPGVLDRFYKALIAVLKKDWRGAIRELQKEGIDRLRVWVGSQIGGACSSAGPKLADAVKALRDALLATTIPHPCEPSLCASQNPPTAAAEICARLWALCSKAELQKPVTEVSAALARLTAALKSFGEGDPCLPTPVEGAKRLVDQLRALDAARASFGHVLAEFFKALATAAETGMADAAAHEAAVLTAALIALLRPPSAAFDHLKTALEPALGAAAASSAVDALRNADEKIGAAQEALEKAKNLSDLRQALAKLDDAAKPAKVLDDLIEAGWRVVGDTLLAAALPAAIVADTAVKDLLKAMDKFLETAQGSRKSAVDELSKIDVQLDLHGEERLTSLLFLDPTPRYPDLPTEVFNGTDRLDAERTRVDKALSADGTTRADELASLVQTWFLENNSSVELILRQLGERVLAAARHKLLRVLDVDGLRNQLQEALTNLIPARRRFEYAWAAPPFKDLIPLGDIVGFRGGGFSVHAESVLDLTKAADVTGHVSGSIGDFDISMNLEGAKCLTLFFSGIGFEASPGAPARVEEPKLKSFKPEGSLLFLAGLAAYCKLQDDGPSNQGGSADGRQVPNGIYTIPRPDGGPGLRAGYGLSFGALQIGTMAILDVVFDAHVELPFDGDAGHAQISLSTSEKPATLVCAPYGGTAYATLRSVPKLGQVPLATEFDVGFQFGAAVAIEFGILSGSGRVMTGLRVFQNGDGPGFSALFVAAFEGHIACFGIAASFVLAMTYQGGELQGEATLTYSFSLGPLKKSFSVRVSRNAGGGLENKSASLDLPDSDGPRIILASTYIDDLPASRRKAYLRSNVSGMMQNWPQYTARYGKPDNAIGRRRRS